MLQYRLVDDTEILDRVDTYLNSVQDFCPYISPSQKNNTLRFFPIEARDFVNPLQDAMLVALLHCEAMRKDAYNHAKPKSLISDNLIFLNSGDNDILEWPHWFLKVIFANQEMVFGKFYTEIIETSLTGEELPKCPFDILTMRFKTSVKNEEKFFNGFETVRRDMKQAKLKKVGPLSSILSNKQMDSLNEDLNTINKPANSSELKTLVSSSLEIYETLSSYVESLKIEYNNA